MAISIQSLSRMSINGFTQVKTCAEHTVSVGIPLRHRSACDSLGNRLLDILAVGLCIMAIQPGVRNNVRAGVSLFPTHVLAPGAYLENCQIEAPSKAAQDTDMAANVGRDRAPAGSG